MSLGSQNESLQSQLSRYEARRHADAAELVDVKGQLDALEHDHDELQQLHHHLTCDHDNLLTEHARLKTDAKQTKLKVRELMERNSTLSREMDAAAQVSFVQLVKFYLTRTAEINVINHFKHFFTICNSFIVCGSEDSNVFLHHC